jgi:hypothetical protein
MKPEISMIMHGRSDGNETISVRFVDLVAHLIDQGVSAASYDGTSGRNEKTNEKENQCTE